MTTDRPKPPSPSVLAAAAALAMALRAKAAQVSSMSPYFAALALAAPNRPDVAATVKELLRAGLAFSVAASALASLVDELTHEGT